MADIKFFIPEGKTIPTVLELRVNEDISVNYKRNDKGFEFCVWHVGIDRSIEIVNEIIELIKSENDDPKHSATWRTKSIKVVKADPRYGYVLIQWDFYIRDAG